MTVPIAAIEARGLGKRYRLGWKAKSLRAVDAVSLRISAGSTFGLLGPNGAGKTSFVKMLLGMTTPTEGEARLFGIPSRNPAARRRVGYLPENGRYPGYHTARSFLEFHGKLAGVASGEISRRIDEVLTLVSMREWAQTRIAGFSKGMLQRLGIAQAILHRPDLLMLDEPTDGVDPVGRSQIRKLLLELNAQGVTIFLNSHILAEVEQFCAEVALLHRGRLLLHGAVAELTQRPGYSIHCESLKGDLPQGLDHIVSEHPTPLRRFPDGRILWHVEVANRDHMNAALDLLRRHRSEIESVEKHQTTLEQVFLSRLREVDRG